MNTIVVDYVYRKIGELWIIILKVLALDLADSVKNPHLGSKKGCMYVCMYVCSIYVLIF